MSRNREQSIENWLGEEYPSDQEVFLPSDNDSILSDCDNLLDDEDFQPSSDEVSSSDSDSDDGIIPCKRRKNCKSPNKITLPTDKVLISANAHQSKFSSVPDIISSPLAFPLLSPGLSAAQEKVQPKLFPQNVLPSNCVNAPSTSANLTEPLQNSVSCADSTLFPPTVGKKAKRTLFQKNTLPANNVNAPSTYKLLNQPQQHVAPPVVTAPRNIPSQPLRRLTGRTQPATNASQTQLTTNASQTQPTANASQTQPTVIASQTQPTINASQTQPTANASQTQPTVNATATRRNDTFPEPIWSKTNPVPTAPDFIPYNYEYSPHLYDIQDPTPYKFFSELWTPEIMEKILFETNLYAHQSQKPFKNLTMRELETFLGINILMGIKKLPSYRDYWSDNPDLKDYYISKQMTVHRFGWILSHLHCNDNMLQPQPGSPDYDKVYKIKPILTLLPKNVQKCKSPSKDLVVDESMVKFLGRHSAKQFMPQKPIKRGFKLWMLNDKEKYTHDFEIYSGKKGDKTETDLGGRVVRQMTEQFKDHNHHVYIDNYFLSIPLVTELKGKGIFVCGTIKPERKYLPKFKDPKQLKRGHFDYSVSDKGVSAYRWMDNKSVHLVSSFHSPLEKATVQRKLKDGTITAVNCPKVLDGYNHGMNNTDVFDQLKGTYAIGRKSHKWWHRLFFHLLDMAIINSYILCKNIVDSKISSKNFRRRIVDALLSPNQVKPPTDEISPKLSVHKPTVAKELREANAAHMPFYFQSPRRCANCSTKKEQKRTNWGCTTCDVPLCLNKTNNCFKEFHGY